MTAAVNIILAGAVMPLLSLEDARRAVVGSLSPRPPVRAPLGDVPGLCLAEPVTAPEDAPPFDRATMDGYAVRSVDCARVPIALTVLGEIAAGAVPAVPVAPGGCVKIMTGAPLPDGADAVIPVEVSDRDGDRVTLSPQAPPRPGAAVARRGSAVRAGEPVVPAGVPLTPAHVGLLAAAGVDPALVRPRPRVAVLSTGDEVVPPSESPRPGQIRDANGPLLCSLAAAAGAAPVPLGIAGDDPDMLAVKVRAGLAADVLLVSGGVSAGDYDLVLARVQRPGGLLMMQPVRGADVDDPHRVVGEHLVIIGVPPREPEVGGGPAGLLGRGAEHARDRDAQPAQGLDVRPAHEAGPEDRGRQGRKRGGRGHRGLRSYGAGAAPVSRPTAGPAGRSPPAGPRAL